MDSHAGPVILINKFNVEPDDVDQFLKVQADSGWPTEFKYASGDNIAVEVTMVNSYTP